MTKNTLFLLLFLFIGCKQNAQNYNYELEDSDQTYVMDSWSNAQKEDYYKKTGELINELLKRENYINPNKTEFTRILNEKLWFQIDSNKSYQIIPNHIFQEKNSEEKPFQLIVFPKERLVSLKSELPLLNKASVEYYSSSDYQNLDHSKEYNVVLNKLLFNENKSEVGNWLKEPHLTDLFVYLVSNFHYTNNDEIFQLVINKLKNEKLDNNEINDEVYLSLLFNKENKNIDKDFLLKISKIDSDRKMYSHFKSILLKAKLEKFQAEVDKIYSIENLSSSDSILQKYLKPNYQIIDEIIIDLDGDNDLDKIYVTSSNDEITNSQLIIIKNDNNIYSLWEKNENSPVLGQKEYKKTVVKGSFFTIEYSRDIEEKYSQSNYLTFKVEKNKIFLHKYSQEVYNYDTNKNLPAKIWTRKNFGYIDFKDVSYNFIENLK